MMGRRAAPPHASAAAGVPASERVLQTVSHIYESGLPSAKPAAKGVGLKAVAEDPLVQLSCPKPRRRITVMLIGNHSAGKSSFINWYIGEPIQKEGVAIETRGFTIVTAGKRRETLTGDATLLYSEHLSGLGSLEGLAAGLSTEISTSTARSFANVDFIDTPGLVDGDMKYPFAVEDAIALAAEYCDLILVFLDPIGQALCRRTMAVISRLNEAHAAKCRYYMSKADQVENEADRQSVLIQITQNLASRVRATHAFALPTIYRPHPGADGSVPNAIEDVCEEIDKSIAQKVQTNLANLKADTEALLDRCDAVLSTEAERRTRNARVRSWGLAILAAAWACAAAAAAVAASEAAAVPGAREAAERHLHIPPGVADAAERVLLMGRAGGGGPSAPEPFHAGARRSVLAALSAALVLWVAARAVWREAPALPKRDAARLRDYRAFALALVKTREDLYKEYFQSLSGGD